MKLIQIRDTAHGTELRVKYILVGQRQQLAWHHVVSFCDLYLTAYLSPSSLP